jgi:hypothetical protein
MFSWIWNNKEWLFSGVGIVVVVSIFQLARYLRRRKSRVLSAQEQAGTPEITKEIGVSGLSPHAIIKKIDKAPVLQKADVTKNYIGLCVAWEGKLSGAENTGEDLVHLHIRVPWRYKEYSVFLDVHPSQYPGLRLLKEEHPVRISGRIAEIRRWIQLEDAHIEYDLGSLNK